MTTATASLVVPNKRDALRALVRGAYDIQALRIMMGNRIVAQFKAKLGQKPSTSEEESIDEEGTELLDQLREDFKLMMDGVKSVNLATFKATPLIATFTEFSLMQQYLDLEASEARHFRNLGKVLTEHSFYNEWLSKVKGIGPAMAGVIMSEIDISKARYPSSLWQYAGLGVEADHRGTSRRKEHLKDVSYTDKEGNPAVRKGITFNPFLKTKLMGVLSGSFLRVKGSPYRTIYDNYKARLENRTEVKDDFINWSEESKGHRHHAALRYMIKMLLLDLYKAWRAHEGLPVAPPYSEAKLSMAPHSKPMNPHSGEGE